MNQIISPITLYNYLSLKGVPYVHNIGILVNVKGESGFNAGIQEKRVTRGRGGYGLFQHTGSRRIQLEHYCSKHKKPVWDWEAQVDFTLQEADTKRYLEKEFEKIPEAAEWWCRHWERPANPDQDVHKRVAYIPGIVALVTVT